MTDVVKRPPRSRSAACAGLVCLALAAVTIGGCGGSSNTRTVASLPSHGAAAGARVGPLTQAQSDRDMIDFARCMRAHGVQMSDPFHRPGHSGLSINLPTQDAATQVAYGSCNHFIEAIVQAKSQAFAAESSGLLAALTRYAECMRARDISMLDPTPMGQVNLGHVPGITDEFGRYSPQFRSADRFCRHFLPASTRDDGTGP